jgi:hypothetical protein
VKGDARWARAIPFVRLGRGGNLEVDVTYASTRTLGVLSTLRACSCIALLRSTSCDLGEGRPHFTARRYYRAD